MDVSQEDIERAQKGDADAFEMIYKTYSAFVYNCGRRIVQSSEDAEELTQEVFLKVYYELKNFRYESSLKTWIYRVTVNMAINFAKKKSRHSNREVIYNEADAPVDGDVRISSEREHQKHLADRLLGMLSPDQRAVVTLRSIEGLSYDEIAETLKINLNTVRTRLKRAREKMMSLKSEITHDQL